MSPPDRILVVDDDRAMGDFLVETLGGAGREVRHVSRADAAVGELSVELDLVVTDLRMPGIDGLELCRRVVERVPDVPVIVLTAFGDYEAAVAAIRAGAYDFLSKPVKRDVLEHAVTRAVDHRRLRREVKRLAAGAPRARPGDLLGESAAMGRVHALLARIADSDSTVLVTGESGTGKELVARELHAQSPRAARPFVAINCAAVPATLLESELFGHERGAFTDAKTARAGLFVEAHGGTIFLDEIGEMPLALQPKLLRTLQDRVVRPVGANKEVPFDARIVAATNRDLETAVEEGRFREDLFFRLDVIGVPLPPLRARGNDVLHLAAHFLARYAQRAGKPIGALTTAVAKHLVAYDWPGNVRELENVIERAVALAAHDELTVEDLPEKLLRSARARPATLDGSELVTLEEMEHRYILRVLEALGGNRALAAKTLGLDRTTLWRKLERRASKSPKS
ncbi:MAG: sigma-54-dependent Fis family transcriptional regulator [Labilithrix sp.]|nr:sigma-54-dependent Fis family transcriptional regulator [Labilithrix sp.]